MARIDPQVFAHLEWLGFVRPTGLVVSAPALVRAGAILDRRDTEGQRLLKACLLTGDKKADGIRDEAGSYDLAQESNVACIADFRTFAATVLNWSFSSKGYAGTEESPIPAELEVSLPDAGEILRPDYAVRELDPPDGGTRWQLLVRVIDRGQDLDRPVGGKGRLELSEHSRMERLLRETGVPAGLLANGETLRLISAPRGESSGWLDFRVADMVQSAGRPISAALRLLLSEQRLLALPRQQRLAALLADSRKFQNEVSEKLAEQVLHALYELLRGFQAAHDASKGELLKDVLAHNPDQIYRGLLTVILRLVFLLYAEERDMLPGNETFLRYYSLAGLYERLREDAALFPDTMGQRFGAWAQLLALFRMVHDGAQAPGINLPPRHGVLFDPDRYLFLEGRSAAATDEVQGGIEPPLVPDGTIYRALEKLLVLDGERISYRALDVEQIGSVYETMMGFRLETATGRSIAVRAQKRQGAPTAIDLDALLGVRGSDRAKWLQDRAGRKLSDTIKSAVASARSVQDLHAALLPVVDLAATPDLIPKGAMVLQPSEERRRSGSHYTPRELTAPIVRTTLAPVIDRLREGSNKPPRPEQILDLKVCDPAMGSGAFLVETCRFLSDLLVESWQAWDAMPQIPADESAWVYARRLVAQRCLYGVDRNPVAVDLAKMSLWLATLARDHPLTFLDHALRHGDSLVGLSRHQLEVFHWNSSKPYFQAGFEAMHAREHLQRAAELRQRIREADENLSDQALHELWNTAQSELDRVRLLGDLTIAAFFQGKNARDRERKRAAFADAVVSSKAEEYKPTVESLRYQDPPLAPFHWEIEFPEVFGRDNPGFDAFVGNPPFAGKNAIGAGNVSGYADWLKELHEGSHGNSDLVAHFFRRAFTLLRQRGTFGLIATNTIAQGDTRATGLRWICTHGGEIFSVRRRVKWPGIAAVVVSVVHVIKGRFPSAKYIDGNEVPQITAFLFHRGGHDDPQRLAKNQNKSFVGSYVLGMGFTFDDTDTKGVATPISEMHRILQEHPECEEVIFPYIGGEEVNSSPTHSHHRYVINFGVRNEEECRKRWPELMAIVEAKVRPERMKLADNPDGRRRKTRWWQFGRTTPALDAAVEQAERVLVISRIGEAGAFTFLPGKLVYAESLIVFPVSTFSCFCALQARPHEIWARFFGSSMKDDLRYTPSDCFETFPFPENWENLLELEAAGKAYYEFRAELMARKGEGLTKTYNRFHDPNEEDPDIDMLRELHGAMDKAVLRAYGWDDIPTACEFILDYEGDDEEFSPRRKPYRCRWPDEVQAEVLSRLLELNAERARVESASGVLAEGRPVRKNKGRGSPNISMNEDLFS